ncbi:MAG: hypothetical protein MHM6MM_003480 [Cercozoa sp. M6MM]
MSKSSSLLASSRATARAFLDYVNASPSPFHCCEKTAAMLENAGFRRISERSADHWKLGPGDMCYFTRNQSTIVAFAIGKEWKSGDGFAMLGAHTDSPCLRLKPRTKLGKQGVLQLAVETYGGGLWHTWFDRDLSLAGRVIVRNGDSYTTRLVRIDRALLKIPMLAIHLNRTIRSDGFKPNPEDHLQPVLATEIAAALEAPSTVPVPEPESEANDEAKLIGADSYTASQQDEHHATLLELLSQELHESVDNIANFELFLYDTQPSSLIGVHEEFVSSPRLDNQLMSFLGIRALIDSLASLETDNKVRIVALFDNEEVGSQSDRGAGGDVLKQTMQRIESNDCATYAAAVRNSLLVSADMAHAVHPNYANKHDTLHRPLIHKGLVLKTNVNERYATNLHTAHVLREVARRHKLPLQQFSVRNDMGCGSTIGPISAANLGVRVVDVGVPQWGSTLGFTPTRCLLPLYPRPAVHSIRETCGVVDIETTRCLFTAFFDEFSQIDTAIDYSE